MAIFSLGGCGSIVGAPFSDFVAFEDYFALTLAIPDDPAVNALEHEAFILVLPAVLVFTAIVGSYFFDIVLVDGLLPFLASERLWKYSPVWNGDEQYTLQEPPTVDRIRDRREKLTEIGNDNRSDGKMIYLSSIQTGFILRKIGVYGSNYGRLMCYSEQR